MKKHTFFVQGLHCPSCRILIEQEILKVSEVSGACVSLQHSHLEIEGCFGDKSKEVLLEELKSLIEPHGYTLSLEKQKHSVTWRDFYWALPGALLFIAFFLWLQTQGLVNLITTSEVSYATAFLIGIIASLSTCMATVGGLLLSVSANFAKEGAQIKPQIYFHFGRLLSFFILGGILGMLGSSFELSPWGNFLLNSFIALVMLLLGINLLEISPSFGRFQPRLPQNFGVGIHQLKTLNHTLTPLLIGILTFFLPCGFTQSMQVYAFGTGNFWSSALILFSFALGTLPVLSLLSFSSFLVLQQKYKGIFFKTAGLLVLFFAVFNLLNNFVAFGLIKPLFNF